MSKGYKAVYLTFCAGIAFLVWTLAYGVVLGVVYKDSRILNITITENPFAPLQQVWAYASNSTLQRVAIGAFYLPSPPPYLRAISVLRLTKIP